MKRSRAVATLLVAVLAGCSVRVHGTLAGPFSHGEDGEVLQNLPDPPTRLALHWDRSELEKGVLTLEYATVHERVALFRKAWFHRVEVVQEREGEYSHAMLLTAGVCALTVVLFPIGVLLFLNALFPSFSPPFGRVVPGEYHERDQARVVERFYRPTPPPYGSVVCIEVRPSEELAIPSRTRQDLVLGRDGRSRIDITRQLRRAADGGSGLVVLAQAPGTAGGPGLSAVLELGAEEVRDAAEKLR